jgi:hypothetical protein
VEHPEKERRIVLSIGIHDGKRRATRRIESLDDCGTETSFPLTPKYSDMREFLRGSHGNTPRLIRRIVIHNDNLVRYGSKHGIELFEQ